MVDKKIAEESWEKLLTPASLRGNLLSIALFIAAYEFCEDIIIDKLKVFYSDGFDADGVKVGPEYNEAVRANLSNKYLNKSVKKNKALAASLGWLNKMGAIEGDHILKFSQIRAYRNAITHEMMGFLSHSDKSLKNDLFGELVNLIDIIEKWWFVNFEAAIDPDIFPEGANIEDVVPGPVLLIKLMSDIALGGEPEEGYYLSKLNEALGRKL